MPTWANMGQHADCQPRSQGGVKRSGRVTAVFLGAQFDFEKIENLSSRDCSF